MEPGIVDLVSVESAMRSGASTPADSSAARDVAIGFASRIVSMRMQGKTSQARSECARFRSWGGPTPEVLALEVVLGSNGEPPAAPALLPALDQIVADNPDAAIPRLLAAEMLGRVGAWDQALGAYEALLRREPDSAWAWTGSLGAAWMLGRLDEVSSLLREIPESCWHDEVALLNTLRIAAEQRDWPLASRAYKTRCALLGIRPHWALVRWGGLFTWVAYGLESAGVLVSLVSGALAAALLVAGSFGLAATWLFRRHLRPKQRARLRAALIVTPVLWLASLLMVGLR